MSIPSPIVYSVKDKNNHHSLVNICPTVIAERIMAIPDAYIEMTEAELCKHYNPTKEDRLMRVAFYQEIERATRTKTNVNASNIHGGMVNGTAFYKHVVTNSLRLAYIIKPFPEYEIQLEEMLHLANDRMREILVRNAVDEEGKFDHKLASLQHVVWEKIQDRKLGSVTKKLEVDSKSVNLTVQKTISTPADLDKQLQELEAVTAREVQAITYEEKD